MKKIKFIGMQINKTEILGLVVALITIILDYIFLLQSKFFYFILGISFFIGGFPFFIFLIIEAKNIREKNRMFLEFSRNLVENVRTGIPISKSIINLQSKDYGVLNPNINKLANQISIGIPIKTAFQTFARDTDSSTISKAINIISESEKAGGQIEDILESVVTSISQIEKLKKERKNALFGLVVQGYLIFLIFIVIMLVMEFKILPIALDLEGGLVTVDAGDVREITGVGERFAGEGKENPEKLTRPFLWLLIVQGFFTGLIIGKISEGSAKAGLKHSFVFLVLAILINTGSKVVFG